MSAIKIYMIVFAIFMIAGGYMGFKKANSKMSLIMGLVSGILILLNLSNYLILSIISIVLALTFTKRFLDTKKFMPSGMLLILSVLTAIISLIQVIPK